MPSTTIMLRQPMSRMYQMQATDIDIQRMQVRKTKQQVVGHHTAMAHLVKPLEN